MEHPRQFGSGSRHDPTVVVFLSLYLLLLAFFVLLNSISQQVTTRAEDAMGSVNSSFRKELLVDTRRDTNAAVDGAFAGADSFRQTIRALFSETLPVAQLAWDDKAGALRATFPTEALFAPGEATIRDSATELMNGIADSVAMATPGVRFETELLLGSAPALPRDDGLGSSLVVRRAGHFARQLRVMGAPATAVSVGLRESAPDALELNFYARDPERARLTFEAAGRQP